jgi:hypothetical protein
MHRTGTGIQRHVVAKDRRHVEIEERMLKAHQFKLGAVHRRQDGVIGAPTRFITLSTRSFARISA